jgi:hypothetical protein
MNWLRANIIDPVANTASSVKNMVVSRVPAVRPLVSEETTQKANVMLGGRREKRGYTCTGARMRRCRKTRTRRRR